MSSSPTAPLSPPSSQVTIPRSPFPSRPAASPSTGVLALPVELLLHILAEAHGGERRASYSRYMLVCQAFLPPARRLLHEAVVAATRAQAEGFLRSLKEDPSLATATRRLTLLYSIKEDDDSLPTRRQASRILKLLTNLRDLTVLADDDDFTRLIPVTSTTPMPTPTGLERLQVLKTKKTRWDRMVKLLSSSPHVYSLDMTALYELPADKEAAEAVEREEEEAEIRLRFGDEEDEDEEPDSQERFDQLRRRLASSTVGSPGSEEEEEVDDALLLTVPRPPSPSTSPPPMPHSLPPSLSLPLRSLTLDSPTISDATTQELATSVQGTLTTLRLLRTTTLTRLGLILVLSSLPNLLELEITHCQFAPALPTDPLPPPPLTAQHLLHPMDHLPQLCPFLQWLRLESEHLGSQEVLTKLAGLPLSCLSIGFGWPRIEVEAVGRALEGFGGRRLDSLVIGVGMKWTTAQLDEVRKMCENVGTLFVGEAVEPPVFLF